MKCINTVLIILLTCTSFKPSDCTLNSILPFTLGSTKFQVVNKINEMGVFKKRNNVGGIYYDMQPTECYSGTDNQLLIKFSDDQLYYYSIETKYALKEYNTMIKNYRMIVDKLSSHPTYKKKTKRYISNPDTKEQTGEGVRFSSSRDSNQKPDNIEVTYKIEKDYYTNEEAYIIEVSFVNLRGTTLNAETGY